MRDLRKKHKQIQASLGRKQTDDSKESDADSYSIQDVGIKIIRSALQKKF